MPYRLDLNKNPGSDALMLFINTRVQTPGGKFAAAGLGLSADALAQSIRGYKLGQSGFVYLVNADGSILIHKTAALADGKHQLRELPGFEQAALAATATVPAVSVRLEDRAGVCGATCARSLGIAFAEAITTWKAGCKRYDQNAMSVLTVGTTTWVDGRIASRLRAAAGNPPLDLNRKVSGETARSAPPSIVRSSA